MKLNEAQKEAVYFQDNICVEACPGSGKTRTVVAKLLKCIDEVRDTPRRIACITYTHAAVNEIEMRLHKFGSTGDDEYCDIGTLHSFCLSNILQPFHYMLNEFRSGFKIIAPDSEEWRSYVSDLMQKYSLGAFSFDSFTNIHRKPDNSIFVPSAIPDDAARELIEYFDTNALIGFSDIVYHSVRLVQTIPFISRGLGCRYAWMLIDEFQDTSDGQVAILSVIARNRKTKFFLVGDPNQSIMAFAGAHPILMQSFPNEIGARTNLRLPGNYRCSQEIVEHAERLIQTNPTMRAVGLWRDYPIQPEYYNVENSLTGVFEYYLPTIDRLEIPLGEAAVLAPWWIPLYNLARELREQGVPVIGPGARPYRRTRIFGPLAEHLCAYTEDGSPDLFRTTLRTLFLMLLNVTGIPVWNIFSYEGRKCLCRLTTLAREIREEYNDDAVGWLRNAALEITKVLLEYEFLPIAYSQVLLESAEEMIQDMESRIDITNLSVSDLGLYARPKDCLQLITMHSSKGREFDAVAIIDLHEGRVPHFSCDTQEQYDEARRLLFVSITRARKLLMYFTDSSRERNRPSPFLSEIGLV